MRGIVVGPFDTGEDKPSKSELPELFSSSERVEVLGLFEFALGFGKGAGSGVLTVIVVFLSPAGEESPKLDVFFLLFCSSNSSSISLSQSICKTFFFFN